MCVVYLAGLSSSAVPAVGRFGAQGFRFNPDVAPSQAAYLAAKESLLRCDLQLEQIDFVISSTQTPDYNNPGLVSGLLHKLGKSGCPGLELKQMALGCLYALDLGAQLIKSKQAQCVLVCCTELLSRYFPADLNQFPNLSVQAKECSEIFADGANAFLLFSEKIKARCADKNCYRLIFQRALSLGCSESSMRCNLPSSCQFPQRISAEDVREGRHLPLFDSGMFQRELRQVVSSPDFLQMQQELKNARSIISHQTQPQQNLELGKSCNIAPELFFDIFAERRHIASAGLPQGLLTWQGQNQLKAAEKLALLGIGAGGNLGVVILGGGNE